MTQQTTPERKTCPRHLRGQRPWAVVVAAGLAMTLPATGAVAQFADPGAEDDAPIFAPAPGDSNDAQDSAQPSRTQPEQPSRVRPERPRTTQPARGAPAEETITIGTLADPWELTSLVDWVGRELNINIIISGSLTGSVTINAPYEFPKSKLLRFLDGILEQYGYTITYDDDTGFYVVRAVTAITPAFEGGQATTSVIRTPNVKPSLLLPAINRTIAPGTPAAQADAASPVTAIDELGVLVVTASPRTVRIVQRVVDEFLELRSEQMLHRIELERLSASVARQRLIMLSGGEQSDSAFRQNNNARGRQINNQQGQTSPEGFGGSSLSNLPDRLAVDAQGNALLFKGSTDELDELRQLVSIIDVPNTLKPKQYFAGSTAQQVADLASRRGLGEVIVLDNTETISFRGGFNANQFQQNQTSSQETVGGPVMVVDPERGSIVYYGTETQQAELAELMDKIGAEDERVVIRTYVLEHSIAEDVANILENIITGQQRTGESALLPGGGGQQGGNVVRNVTPRFTPEGDLVLEDGSGDDVSAEFDPDEVIVVPDEANNQIVVRAPLRQQGELGRLISKLDLRRPQVYIEAMIVSVSDTKDFNLAVETQILNGQYGLQTNFGLSTPGADGFQDQRNVAAGLGGLTAALIQSESIPFIINAMQTDTDARIVSRPALLVNNNEEASIVSIDEQPTTSTSQGDNSTITTFDGFEEAGTNLTVTPTISDGGYLRLAYDIELSSFTGAGAAGIPSPRQTNNVASAVTVPSDATIVVGGIRIQNNRNTVVKVPLLGDIPILKHLFRDTSKISNNSVLYIFITPKIMTDPNFLDIRLNTDGPQSEAEIDDDVPELEPIIIEVAPRRDGSADGGNGAQQ